MIVDKQGALQVREQSFMVNCYNILPAVKLHDMLS